MGNFKFGFLIISAVIAISHVDALYSHKCKEAETSDNKLTRMVENANCTIAEKRRKIHEHLNNLQKTIHGGLDRFKNRFAKTTPQPATTTTDESKLDFDIDVRMLTDDANTKKTKRQADEEEATDENLSEVQTDNPEEDSTIAFEAYGILRAPRKCGPNKVAVNGNCRTIYK